MEYTHPRHLLRRSFMPDKVTLTALPTSQTQSSLTHSTISSVSPTTPPNYLLHQPAMSRIASTTILSTLALTATLSSVQLPTPAHAHGYISQPSASYSDAYTKTKYNTLLNENVNAVFRGRKWDDSPEANARTFTECFRAGGFTSLRALLDPVAPGCGNSRTDVTPVDVSSLSTMQFKNDEYREGFVRSHRGPCEAWIDNTRVFHSDDCAAQFTAFPATLPVDYAACAAGKSCTLTFYWLALHESQWQVYKQCVPVTRLSGGNKSLRQ